MTGAAVPDEKAPVAPRGWLGDQLRVFLTGVMFLTRLPVPGWVGHEAEYLARSTPWFPVIGVVVGLWGGACFWVARLGWPAWIAAAVSTIATVWLTGAFHEDALADVCDGFGGGWGKDQILAIMKDSRVGSYGVVGLGLVLVAKLAALAMIAAPADVVRVLVAGHVLGRWSSLPLIWRLEYVRETGSKSKPFAASVTVPRLVVGTLLAVAAVVVALGQRAMPALVVALVVTWLAGRYYRKVIGGITGDCLGAANQLVELATYLVLTFAWRGWGA